MSDLQQYPLNLSLIDPGLGKYSYLYGGKLSGTRVYTSMECTVYIEYMYCNLYSLGVMHGADSPF